MTCAKRGVKRPGIYKRAALTTLALLASACLPLTSLAQGGIERYTRQFTIGGRLPGAILLVGWSKDAKDIQKLLDLVIARANESFGRLDWRNRTSEVARLNASAGKGAFRVSGDVLAAFQAAQKVSRLTGGAFDIAYSGPGNYRNIKLKSSAVEFNKPGMRVSFDPIMEGFLADLILRYIYASNMRNAIVKVGNVFRGMGQDLRGPWKIQVRDNEGTYAHHALNLTIGNTGVATISAGQFRSQPLIDPRSKKAVSPSLRGATIVMKEAALAQGMAHAIFVLGPNKGMAMLKKSGQAKGLIVDNAGKFIRSPGF